MSAPRLDPIPFPDPAPTNTLLAIASGPDRPGLTSTLVGAVARIGAEILDIEQVVVRDHWTLALLLAPGGATEAVETALHAAANQLGVRLELRRGDGDNARRRSGRAAVVVLGQHLSATGAQAVLARIADHGANIDRIRRLSRYPVTALELDVSGADVTSLRRQLALAAAEFGIDVAVSPGGLARRGARLVVMDVDSTLIRNEVIDLLAREAGREAEVAAVTARAMAGELDFADSLRERVATLAGLPETVLDRVRDAVTLTPGARTLVRTLKRLGFTVALVSGGFTEVVVPLAESLGIEHVRANRLEVRDGLLTGGVTGDIVDRAGKAGALRDIAAELGLPLSRTVAVGDGANDIDMLLTAGLGVAFNAKDAVRGRADAAVNVPYLDSVLFVLGITRDEIEEADEADGDVEPLVTATGPGTAALRS